MSSILGLARGAEKLILRLYLAGESPLSLLAEANLREICKAHLEGRYELETIDVFEDPLRPIQDKIHLTPTLLRVYPTPSRRIVGDLSQHATVLQELGIEAALD